MNFDYDALPAAIRKEIEDFDKIRKVWKQHKEGKLTRRVALAKIEYILEG